MRDKMVKWSLAVVAATMFLWGSMTSTALAAAGNVSWEESRIQATGTGVAPASARSALQARMLARRAAIVDAYRQLAEMVKGVNIDSETTVENMMVTSDVTKTRVSAFIQGARIVSEKPVADGGYEVTISVSMYGVSSLAAAVLEKLPVREPFPSPVESVSATPSASLSAPFGGSFPSDDSVAGTKSGSSAAPAPSGKAIGGFTGLIVDCRGLGLKSVMSPVIKNQNGQPIYGYKNLDYDRVIEKGMAGYAYDLKDATARAGNHPLIVRAVTLEDHSSNPVISTADANRVLIENGASGFLDRMKVVFLR